jgi:peptidyl-prolyl cis-trans isomerase SurA
VTLYELEQFESKQRAVPMPNGEFPSRRESLQALITDRLVAKEISAKGIRVRDEDIDHYIDRIKEQNRLNEDQLKQALTQQGLTWDGYRSQIRHEIEKIQLLNKEIRGRVNVTPEDIQRYYDAHKANYRVPARVKARHIVFLLNEGATDEVVAAVLDRLLQVRKRIVEDKQKFEVVAKQVSEDGAASQGGDLGEIEPEKALPEFAEVLAKQPIGVVSDPIRTAVGLHLVKVESRLPEGHRPVAEVSEEIKDKLYSQMLDERYRRWIAEDLQRHHYVEIQL